VDIDWQRPFLGYSFALLLFPVAALFLYEPERHQHAPKTEGHISGLSLLALILLITFCGSMVIYSIAVQVPFYLKSRFGIGGLGIGLVISSGTLCATFLSLYYGRLRSRLSYPAILVISYLMMGGGFAIVGLAPTVWVLVGGLCFAGGCSGILMPSLNNWLTDVFASASRGKVLGSLNTAIFLGQFMSPIVLTPLLNKVSYTGFFIIIGAAMAFTGGLIWFVRGYLQTASDVLKAQIESKMT
jgi:MFS family permease